MVKDIYEKINSLRKADLEGLYSNYMTVGLEEDDQKDENKPGKAPKPEDMGGDTPNIDPKTGAKIKKPKSKKAESVEIDVKEDGSFVMDMSYFNYSVGLTMTNNKFNKLFGGYVIKRETVAPGSQSKLSFPAT